MNKGIRSSHRNLGLLSLLAAIFLAVTYWRFAAWMPSVFFGDDLANLLAFKAGSFASNPFQAATAPFLDKYRPVFVLLIGLLFKTFGSSIAPYLALNGVLNALNATMAYAIAFRLSGRRYLPSLAVGVATAGSRFALYQVTQVTGLLEGVALVFCLATIYCVIRARDGTNPWRWSWIAIASAFLAIHTHERYVVLAPWLGIALLLLPSVRALTLFQRLAILGGSIGTVAFNVIYKVLFLGIPFFVGTGGSKLGIDIPHVLNQVSEALSSIFGFNTGAAYLAGPDWSSLDWFPGQLSAWVLLASWSVGVALGAICVFIKNAAPTGSWLQRLYWPAMLIGLAALLLAPPILTIRLEQRWLLEPFILAMLIFAWACNVQIYIVDLTMSGLALVLAIGAVTVDYVMSAQFSKIFFVSAGETALAVKQQVTDDPPVGRPGIALLTDPGTCGWTLQNGDFLRFYGASNKATCFGSTRQALDASMATDAHVYSAIRNAYFKDVTPAWKTFVRSHEPQSTFDFLAAYSSGHINNSAAVASSPSGHGTGIMQWNSTLGMRDTLTIISGYSYRYDAIPIEKDSELRFAVGVIYPGNQPARLEVLAEQAGDAAPKVIFSRDVTPPTRGEFPYFDPAAVSLSAYNGTNLSITFKITSPGGDTTGHWVGIADPRIVRIHSTTYFEKQNPPVFN